MKEDSLKDILTRWKADCEVSKITAIRQDASSRRYFRVELADSTAIVAMCFEPGSKAAEVGSQELVPTERAYVELSWFLKKHGIAVPDLLLDAREQGVLLLEDAGSLHLADLIGSTRAPDLYRQAIDQLLVFQEISLEPEFFAHARSFTKEIYLKEMSEFLDYALPNCSPHNTTKEQSEILARCFQKLTEELLSFPLVFSHRDYHSWNLLLDKDERVRVIDFQDALLAPAAYDLASLLNDRDTDSLLGASLHQQLYDYYAEHSGLSLKLRPQYLRVLLQRDLKVVGRFYKLAKNGKPQYLQWVPGTARRIERNLREILKEKDSASFYGELLSEISSHLAEIIGA